MDDRGFPFQFLTGVHLAFVGTLNSDLLIPRLRLCNGSVVAAFSTDIHRCCSLLGSRSHGFVSLCQVGETLPRIHFGSHTEGCEFSSPGLIGCWATMLAFGRAMGAYELPVLYAIGCTLLQGSFCLGELNSVVSIPQHEKFVLKE